jgi:hypothetical protein
MKLKSILLLVTCICLSLTALILASCGGGETQGLSYVLNDDGESYSVSRVGDADDVENIVIPKAYEGKPVTGIKYGAFYRCNAKTIKVPDSVTVIEKEAFSFCDELESVILGKNVEIIGDGAFMDSGIKELVIPASVTEIGAGLFRFCGSLSSIKVESGNTVYDSRNNCNAIIETATNTLCEACPITVIPDDVEAIGNFAFADRRGVESITIPDSVITIGNNAFSGCYDTKNFVIGNSVKSIGNNAFQSCEATEALVLPDSVETIGYAAFRDCESLDSIVIGTSVEYIGQIAFLGVGQRIEVRYRGTEEQWAMVELDAGAGFGYKIMVYNYEG